MEEALSTDVGAADVAPREQRRSSTGNVCCCCDMRLDATVSKYDKNKNKMVAAVSRSHQRGESNHLTQGSREDVRQSPNNSQFSRLVDKFTLWFLPGTTIPQAPGKAFNLTTDRTFVPKICLVRFRGFRL